MDTTPVLPPLTERFVDKFFQISNTMSHSTNRRRTPIDNSFPVVLESDPEDQVFDTPIATRLPPPAGLRSNTNGTRGPNGTNGVNGFVTLTNGHGGYNLVTEIPQDWLDDDEDTSLEFRDFRGRRGPQRGTSSGVFDAYSSTYPPSGDELTFIDGPVQLARRHRDRTGQRSAARVNGPAGTVFVFEPRNRTSSYTAADFADIQSRNPMVVYQQSDGRMTNGTGPRRHLESRRETMSELWLSDEGQSDGGPLTNGVAHSDEEGGDLEEGSADGGETESSSVGNVPPAAPTPPVVDSAPPALMSQLTGLGEDEDSDT